MNIILCKHDANVTKTCLVLFFFIQKERKQKMMTPIQKNTKKYASLLKSGHFDFHLTE